jgi:hypothetical protein
MNKNFFEEVYNNPYHISRNNKSQLYVDNYNKYIKNSHNNNNGKKLMSNIFINNGNYLSNSYNRIYNVFKNNNFDENNNLSKSVDLKSYKKLNDIEINNTNSNINTYINNNINNNNTNNNSTNNTNNNNYNNTIINNINTNNNIRNNINIINNNNNNTINNYNLKEHTIPLIKQYYNNNSYNNNNDNERNKIYSYINSNQNPENSYNSYNKYYSRNTNNKLRIKNLRRNFYNTSEYLYEYVPYDPNNYNINKTRDYKRYDKPITIERDLDRYNIPEFPYDKNFAHKYFNSFHNSNRYINKNNTINNSNVDDNNTIKNNPTIKNSILNKATMKSGGSEEMYIGIIEGQGKNAIKKNDIIDTYIDGVESEIQTKVK